MIELLNNKMIYYYNILISKYYIIKLNIIGLLSLSTNNFYLGIG